MDRKEQWIEGVMNSFADVKIVNAPAGFQQRIMDKITRGKSIQMRSSETISWSLAAGLLLLVSLNIGSLAYFNNQHQKSNLQASSQAMAREYFSSVSN